MVRSRKKECSVCNDIVNHFYGCDNCKRKLVDYAGYPLIRIGNRWVSEYKYIMGNHLGRKLNKGELVHHIDHDVENSNIENLILCKNGIEHSWADKILSNNKTVILKDGKYVELKYKITKGRKLIIEET